ncbi:hypothetical protein FF021_12620 [Leptospira noguchii]|uniref:Uncharacterized protein n=1 Tax=Leptospira noguchii serovar Autumnalis str. ZUN142 TaxID=1085540 RepID=M6UI38_9LEPT|nr:hypothetical protein LEP1GSC186_1621 [Leptospira noguchii serovar Autumnalis str. ZUN142]TQE73265.1 hypothetical protein FF021_12620 [Leptospira noguchii]
MISLWEKISRLEYQVILTLHNIKKIVFVFKTVYSVGQDKVNRIIKDLMINTGVNYDLAYFPEFILQL